MKLVAVMSNCLIVLSVRGGGKLCPNKCREISMNETFPDGAAKREVLNLNVYCINHHQGCQWIGILRDLEVTY